MSIKTTTTRPCPGWCHYSAIHEFEVGHDEAALWRRHEHPVWRLQWAEVDGAIPATVSISQVEQAAATDGPFLIRPVEIVIALGPKTRLTGPQTRQLVDALTGAADLWDAVQKASGSPSGS